MTPGKSFQPAEIEAHWARFWEAHHYARPRVSSPEEASPTFTIMLPPPNVTGSLHMGHAFEQTLIDVLIRYHRMQGDCTLWQGGTDHAGIATQMVVERLLEGQGLSKQALGREAFIQKIWEWKNDSFNRIGYQMRRLGASVDWEHERFTLDPEMSATVQAVFLKLHEEGLVYRGQRLVNWDPVLQTAVSDLEVELVEEAGHLWFIRYPLRGGITWHHPEEGPLAHLWVATTRPETLFGDVAVAVHPADPRFKTLIGQSVDLPLSDRSIPIIGDESVDPAFGTGCVKITPAHDFNDYAISLKHPHLPLLSILDEKAHLNETVPEAYRGLEREKAREKVLADLKAQQLLVKSVPHVSRRPRGDRTGALLEPRLTNQWFVKMKPLRDPALAAVRRGEIRFVPENWTKTYFDWLENIEDWCISRQLWWGHRIPAWYDSTGQAYVGPSEAAVRAKYRLDSSVVLSPDEDVLDTWFSSALWPFSSLGWPDDPRFKTFYPTEVLITGFDIIFFWVARMIMMGLYCTQRVPFSTVFIHGLIQDQYGQKMSKTKGNVIDPLDLIDGIDLEQLVTKRTSGLMQPQFKAQIEKATRQQFPEGIPAFGTDALRLAFVTMAGHGRHLRFDVARVETSRHFCNKLWNAARFLQLNTPETEDTRYAVQHLPSSIALRWGLMALEHLKQQLQDHFRQYRFDWAGQALYNFFWSDFCDRLLEYAKVELQPSQAASTRLEVLSTLWTVFEQFLRLLHPFMPFITEELWQTAAALRTQGSSFKVGSTSIQVQPYPCPHAAHADEAAFQTMERWQQLIANLRKTRSEIGIPPGECLTLVVPQLPFESAQKAGLTTVIESLAKVQCTLSPPEASHIAIPLLHEQALYYLLLQPSAAWQDQLKQFEKQIQALQKEQTKLVEKLKNPLFLEKAPPDVVEKETQRAKDLEQQLLRLKTYLTSTAPLKANEKRESIN